MNFRAIWVLYCMLILFGVCCKQGVCTNAYDLFLFTLFILTYGHVLWYFFYMSLTFGLFCQLNKNFISTCIFLCAMVYKIIQNSQNLMSGVLKRTLTRVCNVKNRFCYQNQNPPSYTIWKVTSAIWLETSTNCIL